jgi:glycosyltransferase involved in cell wall biosynthesis
MSHPLRILLVSGSHPPSPCGVGDYTARLAEALRQKAAVDALILTADSRAPDRSSTVLRVPRWNVKDIRGIATKIAATEPDVVHFQFPTRGYRGIAPWLLPIAVRLLRLPVVVTWHEPFTTYRHRLLYLPSALAAHHAIVVRSDFLATAGSTWRWLLRNKNFATIPIGSNIPQCRLDPEHRVRLKTSIAGNRRLVVYFGFVAPHKGVEQIFEIADPNTDHIAIVGAPEDDHYHSEVRALADSALWHPHTSMIGYAPPDEVAMILAVADAVVLPFRGGGGPWNGSVHAARIQGSLVITTTTSATGWMERQNMYLAAPDDILAMRQALRTYGGRRVEELADISDWGSIAARHVEIYRHILATRGIYVADTTL